MWHPGALHKDYQDERSRAFERSSEIFISSPNSPARVSNKAARMGVPASQSEQAKYSASQLFDFENVFPILAA